MKTATDRICNISKLVIAASIGAMTTLAFLYEQGEITLERTPGKLALLCTVGAFVAALFARTIAERRRNTEIQQTQ